MEIHQLVHTLNYGDAISGEALTIQRLLQERSIASSIYSVNAHEKVAKATRHWSKFKSEVAKKTAGKVALILHYSIASPLNKLFLESTSLQRAMIFHNLTPVRWFSSYNQRVSADLKVGFNELPSIAQAANLLLADSDFNRRELEALKCPPAKVLPLPLDLTQWNIPANPAVAKALKGHAGKNILHVGRLAPNKRIEDIIKAFYFYHHKIERNSRLWLVGIDIDTEIYSFELRRLISELRLKEAVYFAGGVANQDLKAFYEQADLYLCMSEHEGFCVPLLEAMHFGIPVIAYNSCAIRDTLGEGGVLLERKSPAETAELMQLMMSDMTLRKDFIERGKAQVEKFSLNNFSCKLEELVISGLFAEQKDCRS